MAVGDVPLTPIIDTVTGSVTEIGRIFLRTLAAAVNGLAPIDATYWVSKATAILNSEVNLGALAPGYLKLATAVGIATPATVATIPQADVTGLTAALAGKATLPIAQVDVTNLVADLGSKAPLASPALTGVPTAPTAAPGTATAQLATTAFAQAAGLSSFAGQLPFPAAQNPSANPNTLDDYEEGTWTPTLGGSATYTAQEGTYTKIGRLVSLQGRLTVNAIGTGSPSTISGLPFASPTIRGGSVAYFGGAALACTFAAVHVTGTTMLIDVLTGAATAMSSGVAFFGNGTDLVFSVVYAV